MVAIKSEHGVRLVSRNGRDHTRRFPELVKALSGLSGFEGIVAKNPESRYVPGRTLAWLKVKQSRYREGERGWAPKQKP
jgi:ATP-dependent DNA ligase